MEVIQTICGEALQVTEQFPVSEKYGMVSQLRRAAISVCSNLAEGSARRSEKEKSQFYSYSYGSILEILNQLLIALDLGWITEDQIKECRQDIETISFALNKLQAAAQNKVEKPIS